MPLLSPTVGGLGEKHLNFRGFHFFICKKSRLKEMIFTIFSSSKKGGDSRTFSDAEVDIGCL